MIYFSFPLVFLCGGKYLVQFQENIGFLCMYSPPITHRMFQTQNLLYVLLNVAGKTVQILL